MRACAVRCSCVQALPHTPSRIQVDPCDEKPFVVGDCKASVQSWSYNPDTEQCERFYWGGCGGTGNRWATQKECELMCDVQPEDCCPLGEFCCGSGCLADGSETLVKCAEPTCCKLPEPCICTEEYAPVCSDKTGIAYSNLCTAQCAGDAGSLTKGKCLAVLPPPSNCCRDGYTCCGTECISALDAATRICIQSIDGCCVAVDPEPVCTCPAIYAPVCSTDSGRTYSSSCEALCIGEPYDSLMDGSCSGDPILLPADEPEILLPIDEPEVLLPEDEREVLLRTDEPEILLDR
jgi:hypothetical protein